MKRMSDVKAADWNRLGHLLVSRRVALGYKTRSAFASAKGFKNDRTIAAIENAERENFASATLASFEQAYELAAGAIERALGGDDLIPLASATTKQPSLRPELRPIEELTDMELLAELGRRLAQRVVSDETWRVQQEREDQLEILEMLRRQHEENADDSRPRSGVDNPNEPGTLAWRRWELEKERNDRLTAMVVDYFASGRAPEAPSRPRDPIVRGEGKDLTKKPEPADQEQP